MNELTLEGFADQLLASGGWGPHLGSHYDVAMKTGKYGRWNVDLNEVFPVLPITEMMEPFLHEALQAQRDFQMRRKLRSSPITAADPPEKLRPFVDLPIYSALADKTAKCRGRRSSRLGYGFVFDIPDRFAVLGWAMTDFFEEYLDLEVTPHAVHG